MEFGTAAWTSDPWRAGAVRWLDDRLAAAGIRRTGEVEHPHVRAWATVMRVPTDHGVYWMKATGPGTAFEVRLYKVLTDHVPDHVLRPLATDPRRGWMVLPDGGPVLGTIMTGVELGRALAGAIVQYGQVQLAMMSVVDRLLRVGLADMRPAAMPDAFDRAVALTGRDADRSGDPQRVRLHAETAAARGVVVDWCAQLMRSAVPASLDHNDLHPRNIFWDGRSAGSGVARFFDWGDSVVAHPFAAMLVPLGMARQFLGVTTDSVEFVAVRDAYLDLFRDLAPGEDLLTTLETACRVAKVARVHTWYRAIGAAAGLDDEIAGRFRDAPLDTLGAILDEDYLTVG